MICIIILINPLSRNYARETDIWSSFCGNQHSVEGERGETYKNKYKIIHLQIQKYTFTNTNVYIYKYNHHYQQSEWRGGWETYL